MIDYIIQHLEKNNANGLITAYYLAKAFDTVDHGYISRVLQAFGFPANIIQSVSTLYHNAESAVLNNGKTTKYFPLKRSCRQGDPLSPYLFILAFEPLIRQLQNLNNTNVSTPYQRVTCTAFADDLTTFDSNETDLLQTRDTILAFGEFSGLCLNDDKTEILQIGNANLSQRLLQYVKPYVKITGICHGTSNQEDETSKANFEKPLEKLRNILRLWKGRHLSLLGRVMVVKSQGLSQFTAIANAIPIPKKIIQEISKIVYGFIWNGPDKLNRILCSKTIQEGGLGMPLPGDFFQACLLKWFSKINRSHPWTDFLKFDGQKIGGLRCLQHNSFRVSNLDLLPFNKILFETFQKIQNCTIKNEFTRSRASIWNNPLFASPSGRKLKSGLLSEKGFQVPTDFCSWDGGLISLDEAVRRGLPRILASEWDEATSAINRHLPNANTLIGSAGPNLVLNDTNALHQVSLTLSEHELPCQKMTAANISKLITMVKVPWASKFPQKFAEWCDADQDQISQAQKLIKRCSNDTKARSFHTRLLSGLLFSNKDFFNFGYHDTPNCNWCGCIMQTHEHLLFECPKVSSVRNDLSSNGSFTMSKTEWIIGSADLTQTTVSLYFLQYIYHCNYHFCNIDVMAFYNYLMKKHLTERNIAFRQNRPNYHKKKWQSIFNFLGLPPL